MNATLMKVDHLVVVAASATSGIAHVANSLGVAPGIASVIERDDTGGVERASLTLWQGITLTVVAPLRDWRPGDGDRSDARWPALDTPGTRLRIAHGPFLAHWAARVERPRRLTQWARQYPRHIPPVREVRRAARVADVAIPTDGQFPTWRGAGDGLLPTLIQWRDAQPDSGASAADSRIALRAMHGVHPAPELITAHLRWLGVDASFSVASTQGEPSFVAEFDTPSGIKTLK